MEKSFKNVLRQDAFCFFQAITKIFWFLRAICVWKKPETCTVSAPNTVKVSMVNITLSTVCIKKKPNKSKPLKFCKSLKVKPKNCWAATRVFSGILESFCEPMVDKTKKIYKILSQFLLLGLSHLAHPPPEPRCYTASHSNPLCILHALLWEGYHAATFLSTCMGTCAVSDQKSPTSAQGRFLGRSRRMEKEITWVTPMSHRRRPEPGVVLLCVVALHGFLFHWVT